MKRAHVGIIVASLALLLAGIGLLYPKETKPDKLVGPDLVQRSRPLPRSEAEPQQYLPAPQLSLLNRGFPNSTSHEYWLSSHEQLLFAGGEKTGYRLVLTDTLTNKTKVLKQWKPSLRVTVLVAPDRSRVLFNEEEGSVTKDIVWSSLFLRGNQPGKRWRFKREVGYAYLNAQWLSDSRQWSFWRVRYNGTHNIIEAKLFFAGENGGMPRYILTLPDPQEYPINLSANVKGVAYALTNPSRTSKYDFRISQDRRGAGAEIFVSLRSELPQREDTDGKTWLKDGGKLTLIRSSAPEYEEIEDQLEVTVPPYTEQAVVRLSPNGRYLVWSIRTKPILKFPLPDVLDWSLKAKPIKMLRPPTAVLWVTDLQTGKNTLLGIGKDFFLTSAPLTVYWTQEGKSLLWLRPSSTPQEEEHWFSLSLPETL